MIGFRDIEIVRAIAEAGGFRAAAGRFGMSQSAMSVRVAALERRLGVRLFERLGRGVRLSTAGRRLLEESVRLVAARDRIVRELGGGPGLRGTVRIGVAETIVHTLLTPLLAALHEAHPAVRFELTVETSTELARRLDEHLVDVAILLEDAVPGAASRAPLAPVEVDWYAATGRPADAAPLSLESLARESIITYSKGTTPYRLIERLFAGADTPPLLHGSASLSAIRHLIADGFGVGILPRRMVEPRAGAGASATCSPSHDASARTRGGAPGAVVSTAARSSAREPSPPGVPAVRRLAVCDDARPDALRFVVAWLPSDDETGSIVARAASAIDRSDTE